MMINSKGGSIRVHTEILFIFGKCLKDYVNVESGSQHWAGKRVLSVLRWRMFWVFSLVLIQ